MTNTVEFPSLASGLALGSSSASGREQAVDESRALSRAETAECTCPEFCERDHANE